MPRQQQLQLLLRHQQHRHHPCPRLSPFANPHPTRTSLPPRYSGRGIALWQGCHHIWIHHNEVHHAPNSGVRANEGDYISIEYNKVYGNTWWSSNAESGIVFADSTHIDTSNNLKLRIAYNEVFDNVNKIPYYNSNYDDPDYLTDNQMSVAREGYGTRNQTFIIDGSGVYVSRNSESYLYGWMELAHNRCYRNGINGAVVHKTYRVYVHGNEIFDNGQVSRDEPSSRQKYAGLTLHTASEVHLWDNNVTTNYDDDYAYMILKSDFVRNETNMTHFHALRWGCGEGCGGEWGRGGVRVRGFGS